MLKSRMSLNFLVLIILFSSCSKLPISRSETLNPNSENEFTQIATNGYNKTNNVHYGVAHNDTNFYLKAIFTEPESFMKIMRGGLILYFDPSGKKGKDYALKIEHAQKELMDRSSMPQQNMGSRQDRMQNMPKLLNAVLTKVTWDANGKEFVFYRGVQEYVIDVEFTENEYQQVELKVKMPLKELPVPENNLMSMGITTGSVPSGSGAGANGGMRSSGGMGGGRGGGGGMSGGGMSGGGGRGGGGGGGRASGGGPSGASSSNSSPIKIWFQVEL